MRIWNYLLGGEYYLYYTVGVNTHSPRLLFLLALLTLGFSSCSYVPTFNHMRWKKATDFDRELAKEIIKRTNVEREKYGLKAVKEHSGLTDMAQAHTVYQYKGRGTFSGTKGFENLSHNNFEKRYKRAKKRYRLDLIGENIGYTYASPQNHARQMVKGWMLSPKHKKIILDKRWTVTGVGLHSDEMLSWSTQIMGY